MIVQKILVEKPWSYKEVPGLFSDFLIDDHLQFKVLAKSKRPPM